MGVRKKSRKAPTDIEKIVYRFLFSMILGFFSGYYFFPTLLPISVRTLLTLQCTIDKSAKLIQNFGQLSENQANSVFEEDKANIYIGMMSTESKLDTRTATAFQTWAKRHPQIVIEVFANNTGTKDKQKRFVSTTLTNGARIIQLPGVNDRDYPPQKKSFSMIKFMHDVYINDFDWFIRLDDDAYVDTTKLLTFLNGVNSSQPWYIGCAGFGQNKDDFLSKDENYCQGGPGVIMSRALLRKVGPHLGECLHSLFTEHEDIELGRCIHKITGVKCVMAWESTKLFFQNYFHGSYATNIENIDPARIEKGIIFHANKDPSHQQRFHFFTLKQKISKLIQKMSKLERELLMDVHHPTIHSTKIQTGSVWQWNAIVGGSIFLTKEKTVSCRMRDGLRATLYASTNVSAKALKTDPKNGKLTGLSLMQSYQTIHSPFSVDFTLHLTCNYKSSDRTGRSERKIKSVTRTRQKFVNEAIFLREPTSHLNALLSELSNLRRRARETDNIAQLYQAENNQLLTANSTPVNFIVALSGRPGNFIRFLHNFEETFLKKDENVNLYITYFPSEQSHSNVQEEILEYSLRQNEVETTLTQDENEQWMKANISLLQEKYPHSKLKLLLTEREKPFSRGIGLQSAAASVVDENEILFFCDIDLVFSPEMLMHIRRNTISGKQVYYPVFFSQYDPDVVYVGRQKPSNHFRYEELDGYWRSFSYGMVAIYKSDFDKTGGFDLSIKGWGLEDIHLAEAVMKSGLAIFKSNEPAQVHVYHDKTCDPALTSKQHFDCVNSRSAHFGPKTLLYYLWKIQHGDKDIVQHNKHI